jgi:thiol-disulfide isomerase/thioredoxin
MFFWPILVLQPFSVLAFEKASDDEFMPKLIEFFSPSCGHCRTFDPVFKKAMHLLKPVVDVSQIDCSQRANADICARNNIRGVPTVKLTYPSKKSHLIINKDVNERQDAHKIFDYVKSAVADLSYQANCKNTECLDARGVDDLMKQDTHVFFGVSNSSNTPLFIKSLAAQFCKLIKIVLSSDFSFMKDTLQEAPKRGFFTVGKKSGLLWSIRDNLNYGNLKKFIEEVLQIEQTITVGKSFEEAVQFSKQGSAILVTEKWMAKAQIEEIGASFNGHINLVISEAGTYVYRGNKHEVPFLVKNYKQDDEVVQGLSESSKIEL